MENRTFVILAADDEEELLEALQLFLEREHMKLIKAADGPTALRLFEKEQPDLVLLDVMMPGNGRFCGVAPYSRKKPYSSIDDDGTDGGL